MDSRALRYFQVIAELKNYSRAAERLYISQSALSRQIQNLEEELGCALFTRLGHGIALTNAGAYLLGRSRSILRQIDETRTAIRHSAIEPYEVLTLAVAPVVGRYLVPHLIEALDVASPGIFLRVVSGSSANFEDWLSRGAVDLACMYDFVARRGFEVTPCAREELMVFGRSDRLPPSGTIMDARALAQMPLIVPGASNNLRRDFERWMAEYGQTLQINAEVDDHSVLRGCLLAGRACTIMGKGALDADVQSGQILGFPLSPAYHRTVSMVTLAQGVRAGVARDFAKYAADRARELAASGLWPAEPVR